MSSRDTSVGCLAGAEKPPPGRFPRGPKSQGRSTCIINFRMHVVMPVRQTEGDQISRELTGDRHALTAGKVAHYPPHTSVDFHS